jgi:hypothetical protein
VKGRAEQQVTGGLAELERVDLERGLANAGPALKDIDLATIPTTVTLQRQPAVRVYVCLRRPTGLQT